MSEIEDMGVEFVEALRCIADVLKAADHGNYSVTVSPSISPNILNVI